MPDQPVDGFESESVSRLMFWSPRLGSDSVDHIPNQSAKIATTVDNCYFHYFPIHQFPRTFLRLLVSWHPIDLQSPLYSASKGKDLRPSNRATNVKDIHRFPGLSGNESVVALAADRTAFLICFHCSLRSWTFLEMQTALKATIRCVRQVTFVMWPQTRSKQKQATTKLWSQFTKVGQNDRQSSIGPGQRWLVTVWPTWVHRCEGEGGRKASRSLLRR